MNRRTFLGTMTAATLLSRNFSWAAEHKIEKIGIQLYTLRDLFNQDFRELSTSSPPSVTAKSN